MRRKQQQQKRNKEKKAELLCNIYLSIWQWMTDNFLIDEEDTWGKKDVALQKDDANTLDWTCEQRESFNVKKAKRTFVFRTRKRQSKFLVYIKKKMDLPNLALPWCNKGHSLLETKIKRESFELLCNISPFIKQWMKGIFLMDEEKRWGNKNAVLQKDAENDMDGTAE